MSNELPENGSSPKNGKSGLFIMGLVFVLVIMGAEYFMDYLAEQRATIEEQRIAELIDFGRELAKPRIEYGQSRFTNAKKGLFEDIVKTELCLEQAKNWYIMAIDVLSEHDKIKIKEVTNKIKAIEEFKKGLEQEFRKIIKTRIDKVNNILIKEGKILAKKDATAKEIKAARNILSDVRFCVIIHTMVNIKFAYKESKIYRKMYEGKYYKDDEDWQELKSLNKKVNDLNRALFKKLNELKNSG